MTNSPEYVPVMVDDCPLASSATAKRTSADLPRTRRSILGPLERGSATIPARSSSVTCGEIAARPVSDTPGRWLAAAGAGGGRGRRLAAGWRRASGLATAEAETTTTATLMKRVTARARPLSRALYRSAMRVAPSAAGSAGGMVIRRSFAGSVVRGWTGPEERGGEGRGVRRTAGGDATGENEARVEEEVVRHHHGAQERDGDVQRVAAGVRGERGLGARRRKGQAAAERQQRAGVGES